MVRKVLGSMLLAIGLHAPAWGAIAGVPLPPRPGPLPGKWLGWANDAFGGEVGQNPDDFRTNAFDAGITMDQRWILAADLSYLTDKNGGIGSRSDELTVSFGRVLARQEAASVQFTALAGIGARYSGDLGGQDLQNDWHEIISFVPVELPYEDSELAGTAWASGQYLWLSDTEAPFGDCVFCDGSKIGINLDFSTLGSSEGELQAELGLGLVWTGHDSVVWTGLRQQVRGGDPMSRVAQIVAEEEEGTWYHYGISAGAWTFEAGVHIANGNSFGRLGWMFDRVPIHRRLGRDVFHTELGLTLNSYGLIGQVRWRPRWLRDLEGLGERSMLLVDYRFGRVPDTDFKDLSVRYQQGTLGVDISALPERDGLLLNPFVYGSFGWRFEDIHHDGPDPALPEADEDGPVVMGGAGLRLTWGDRPHRGRGIQYGITTTYDLWKAFDREEVSDAGPDAENHTLLASDHTVSLRLNIAVGW